MGQARFPEYAGVLIFAAVQMALLRSFACGGSGRLAVR